MGEREPIGVIGTGYVGLVTAAGFAELGSEVWCIDIDEQTVELLRRGEVPIYEPGLEDVLARHRGRLHFSTNLSDALDHARLLFVAVGTPPTPSGDADLSAVNAVVAAMPASDHHALVMKSTVPVGTGTAIKRMFREQGKEHFRYVSCPEFLKDGTALDDFLRPDRVLIGDAGNSGYRFQLLAAVLEVNELQKRRVVGKLQQHLGQLVGKRIALLGLAFKPDTDDMREASSLVLSARLQAEGATVVAYDPIAEE